MAHPLPCPFCSSQPNIYPENPEIDGNAWGEVQCTYIGCPANPSVRDGACVRDDRGSDAYKALAIIRWNTRWNVRVN